MAGHPPLRYLRKTTIIVIVVFLAFFAQRIYVSFQRHGNVLDTTPDTELSRAQGTVCRHIVNGSPFGADSVFEDGIRLYFYTVVSKANQYSDTLKHVWFNGLDTVLSSPCTMNGDICSSMIPPTKLKPGEWSVDLLVGKKLLSSQQFRIESPLR